MLSIFMIFCLAACGNASEQTEGSAGENNALEDRGEENMQAEESRQTESSTKEEVQTEGSDMRVKEEGNSVLVVYFSATNTTEGVAEYIANGLGAELYEIVPEEPYTDADLNYSDDNSRTTIEMNDPDVRPAISGMVENMEQYDMIFIGFAGGIIGLNQEKPQNQGFALI